VLIFDTISSMIIPSDRSPSVEISCGEADWIMQMNRIADLSAVRHLDVDFLNVIVGIISFSLEFGLMLLVD
jgi:hypothetical protein